MASGDDAGGYSLLSNHPTNDQSPPQPKSQSHHLLQQLYAPHLFLNKPIQSPPPLPLANGVDPSNNSKNEDSSRDGDDFNDPAFNSKCASAHPGVAPFSDDNEDSSRRSRDDLSDGGTTKYLAKRAKTSGSGESRRDREEWSDMAINHLLDAFTEKYTQLNRGSLRGRDWEEVAAAVSERCEMKQGKSVEQCKNKVDNLKKRFKLERHKMVAAGVEKSSWPWFENLELIVGNVVQPKSSALALAVAAVAGEEDPGCSRRLKRCSLPTTPSPGSRLENVKIKQMPSLRWRRVVFKISGVALAGSGSDNIDPKVATLIASEVAKASRAGVEVAIVVGGRNFFCGDSWVTATGSDRSTAYQIGIMATVMNSLLLQSALEKMGIQTRVQSGITVQVAAETYSRQQAIRHLEKGRVVIFGGVGVGTGNPFFSTDTAAALRASEIDAEALLKGANTDGVYGCNSSSNNIFEHITFRELGPRGASLMDMMALTYCEENGIPVVFFNLLEPGNISRALCGEVVGTLVDRAERNQELRTEVSSAAMTLLGIH